jgi:hypothetical protein
LSQGVGLLRRVSISKSRMESLARMRLGQRYDIVQIYLFTVALCMSEGDHADIYMTLILTVSTYSFYHTIRVNNLATAKPKKE